MSKIQMNRVSPMIGLAGCLAVFSPASADEYTPAEKIKPAASTVQGGAIDILGFVPGMRCSAAIAKLNETYNPDAIRTSTNQIGTESKGIQVSTIRYTSGAVAESSNEVIGFSCSGSAGGNQVVGIHRTLRFTESPVSSPIVADMVETLIQKYGEPSAYHDGFKSRYWVYRNGTKAACTFERSSRTSCEVGSGTDYSPENFESYIRVGSSVGGVTVYADIDDWYNDKTKVREVRISVVDSTKKRESAKADMDSLFAEMDRQTAEKAKKVPVPKL